MTFFAWVEAQLPILWLISAVLLLILLGWLVRMQWRLSRLLQRYLALMRGSDGKNLEQVLDQYLEEAQSTSVQLQHLNQVADQLEKAAKLSLQHLGVVRFDAFPDVGGQQSFAISLVDGHGNGVVLSGLTGRQNTRMYAKPLQRWEASHNLSDEEKEAIAMVYQQRRL